MTVGLGCAIVLGFGVIMGVALPSNLHVDREKAIISGIIGWVYFAAWSISFYPQFWLNYVRKSVIGMSFDYQLLNVVGFTAYTIFNCSFYYNESVKQQYFDKHHAHNVVQANDVFFALHALFWTFMTCGQIFFYERGTQRFGLFTLIISIGSTVLFGIYAIVIAAGVQGSIFNWLDYVIGVSYVKLGVTLIKYAPQVYLNYSRQSTAGWNVWNVLLDFTGGSLSVLQQLLDCAWTNNWEGISGDPVKFALGLTSMVFDTMFMTQHYCLYAENNRRLEEAAVAALAARGSSSKEESDALLTKGAGQEGSLQHEQEPV
ncbi:unnamed protein product [Symbiodinium sp. KB8]|nr:unnamed protein product [Symbiodinium sp. KB8]